MMRQHTLFAEPPSVAPPLAAPANAELPEVTLLHGDCLEVMPTLAQNNVSMVFCDLPYGTRHRKTTDMLWDIPINMTKLWDNLWSLTSFGVVVATAAQPFASLMICQQLKTFRYDIIWEKTKVGGWFNANRAPLRKHEHILVFCKRQPPYTPQFASGLPYTQHARPPAKAFAARQTRATVSYATINKGTRFPVSVQRFVGREKYCHPTQKPVALLEWLIKTYTNPGDLVLDPTSGSAVTAIAALNTGRRCICIEKDAAYYDIGCRRVAEHKAAMVGLKKGI